MFAHLLLSYERILFRCYNSADLVDKFCYVVHTLCVASGTDTSGVARIHTGWNKFRQQAGFLTDKDELYVA